MSFTDDYYKALEEDKKKKKKQIAVQTTKPKMSLDPYRDVLRSASSGNNILDDDIAPIRTKKDEEEESTLDFFKKVEVDDGWDVAKAILGTAGDVGLNVVKGVASMGEGLGDLIAYGAAGVGDALGKEEWASGVRKRASENTIDELLNPAQDALDKNSILGRTSKGIAQGIGQVGGILATGGMGTAAGLGTVGTTVLTTGTMFASGTGSGMSEAYQGDATDQEAALYGVISGTADAVTELIFGGLGKSINAVGLSKGLSSADDLLAKKLSSKITDTLTKNIVQAGVKAGAEGIEEVLAGFTQAAGKKLTYMSEEDFKDIVEDENLLEQFVVGAFTSGIAQSADLVRSTKAGRDFISGLNADEQSVVDKVYEDRVAKAEEGGKKLTGQEKSKIYDVVQEQMKKGYIDADTVESVLGGESYTKYKTAMDNFFGSDTYKSYRSAEDSKKSLPKLQEEYNTLHAMKRGDMTGEQQDREASLLEQINAIKNAPDTSGLKAQLDTEAAVINDMKAKLRGEVSSRVKESYLAESYNELIRKDQKFEADMSKYTDENAKKTVQSILDSGLGDNSNQFHDTVDWLARISADKGVVFDLTTDELLQGTEHDYEGKRVNAFITDDGKITLNKSSKKALNSTVGHEITHVLEKSGAYKNLQDFIFEYARSREGQKAFDERLAATRARYQGMKNTTAEAELTADLVGDYLFTDYDFISNLSSSNRNLFQKIYDEVKYLYRIATAGSAEQRQLEKVKHQFDKAYRDNIKGKPEVVNDASVEEQGVKYSIREEAPPKNTKKAYKLMRLVDGKLYPLFIGNNEEVSVGTWYNADSPNLSQLKDLAPGTHLVNMETGEAITWDEYAEKYVPKKNGQPSRNKPNKDDVHWANDNGYRFMHIEDKAGGKSESRMLKQYGDTRAYYNWGVNGSSKSKSGEGSASLYALRPGWHFGEVPSMHQIGYGGEDGDTVRLDNQVWVEVEMSADVDYNAEAEANWGGDIPTHIPTDGYYKFATNPTQKKTKSGGTEADATKADWYVAGAFKVNRILSDTEADAVVNNYNKETGRNVPLDYRRNGGRVFNAETMSVEDAVKYSLSSDSNGRQLSDAQKEFFKDSKVVDENGNLKVMYHGTSSGGHTIFDPWGKGRYGLFGTGIYFTDSKTVAESYTKKGKGTNPQVYESYLNITNPMDMDAQADPAQWKEAFPDAYFPESGTNEDFYRAMEEYFEDEGYVRWEAEEEAQDSIYGMGYDGITHIGGGRVNPDGERHRVFIAFQSEQVKNTDNTNPTDDPDIRYSISDSEGNQLSNEQQEFFKDAKTRDADGNLQVLYHGSRSEAFSEFDLYEGVWLTSDPRYAEIYAGQWHSWRDDLAPVGEGRTDLNGLEPEVYSDPDYRVYKMYANIKNPADIGELDIPLSDAKVRELAQALGMRYTELKPLADEFMEEETYMLTRSREFIALATEKGFDGFKATEKGRQTWCAFVSEDQVKLTTNTKPTVNPDVRYSLSEDTWTHIHEMQSEVNRLNDAIREFEAGDAFKAQMKMISEAVDAGDTDKGIKQYQRWIKESGYEDLLNKRNAMRDELENLRKSAEETRASEALEEERKAIEKSGLTEADYFRKQAVKEFGYTPYFYDAGYITTNGKMLNFSGEKGQHFGSRGEDHRAIGIIYAETNGTDALNRFVNDGNIRISPESPGIDLSATVEPTKEQYATIKKFVYQYADKGYFSIDISDKDGKVIGSLEYENRIYPTKVIDDLKHYYETGEIRQQSDIGKFHYSLSEDSQGRELSVEQQEFFQGSKIVDENGNLKVMYHGSPETFTVFDKKKAKSSGYYGKGFYFTDSDSHAGQYGNKYEVYLNITNPLHDGTNNITREQLRNFVKAIAENEDYGIDNYGYGATVDSVVDSVYGKSDFAMLMDINASCVGNMVEAIELFNEVNGTDYNGIIAPTETVAFHPNQIKDVSNKKPTADPDIRESLSDIGETPKTYGNYNIYGKDIGLPADPLAEFAPVPETAQEATPEVAPVQETVSEAELGRLLEEQASLESRMLEAVRDEKFADFNQMAAEWEALQRRTEELHGKFMDENYAPMNDDADYDRLASLDDADAPPEMEAPYPGEPTKALDPFADRDMKDVGKRNVKAYMYENPEVKPFFQRMANAMLGDLYTSIKGEKIFNADVYYESGGEKGWDGTTRKTTSDIAELLDIWHYTYAEIEKGLNAIIEDNGAENNAISKRIEFMLDERLRYGYTGVWGEPYPADQDYINLVKEKQANEYSAESFEGLMANADQYAPQVEEDIAPVMQTPVVETPVKVEAPTREYEAIRPEPKNPKKKPVIDDDIAPVYGDKLVRVDSNNGRPGEKQRKWVGTSTDSEVVDRKVLPDDLDQDLIHYQPISNKKTLGNANAKLDRMGYESSIAYLNGQFTNNKVTLDDIALGERLIQEAVKRGDTKTAGDLIMDISILGTELGQKVQALSIIKRLTPEGQLRMLQRVIERGKARGDKAYEGVELTQDIIDKILSLYGKDGTFDQAKLNEAVEKAKKQIADQMKVTAMDKVNAWRYLSMLGNPKSHIRNGISNVAMRGTVAVKNAVARTIESVAPISNRTKTWKPATDAVKAFARNTAVEMQDVISGDSKYSEDASIKQKRDIFKSSVLNKLYEFNSDWLEKEDWWFSKPAFINSLSEYLTANGIRTEQDIKNNPKIVEKAKVYATEQSQIATFRQYSWLSNKIGEMERHNAATQIAVGSIMPFKKTPINIAKTGLNYSPLGFAKTLTYDIAQVKKGNMEASELVDHLSQNITGSALTLVGYMLASAGFLSGGGEDDKEGKYDYQLGEQGYSINIDGNSYSLSWLSPVAMPLFVGANAYEQLVEGKEWNGDVVVQTLAQTLDPLSEMSFLSGLNDVLSSYGSGMEKFAGVGEAMAQNYITQFVPTLSSQVATVMDDTKRSTKVGSDSGFKFFDETINKLKLKIPVLRQTLEPSTDIWGNDVKQTDNLLTRAVETFLAPYSGKGDISTHVDEEIKSLYRQTGANGLIPVVPDNYVNFKGEKYEMSTEQFTAFKKTYGQTAYNLLDKLFGTETYQNASSEDRADLVERVYDYARDKAKLALLREHGVDYTNAQSDGVDVYKENAIKGAIENDMLPDEYSFSREYPEKYKFFKANNISYADYDSADEDGKRAYTWAYENPNKYLVSKAVTSDLIEYRQYTSDINEIRADKNSKGKTIVGSAKEKKVEYINSLDIDYGQKLILFKSEYPADDSYNSEILDYLNSRSDITLEDEITILRELGFTVHDDGRVFWD